MGGRGLCLNIHNMHFVIIIMFHGGSIKCTVIGNHYSREVWKFLANFLCKIFMGKFS